VATDWWARGLAIAALVLTGIQTVVLVLNHLRSGPRLRVRGSLVKDPAGNPLNARIQVEVTNTGRLQGQVEEIGIRQRVRGRWIHVGHFSPRSGGVGNHSSYSPRTPPAFGRVRGDACVRSGTGGNPNQAGTSRLGRGWCRKPQVLHAACHREDTARRLSTDGGLVGRTCSGSGVLVLRE